MKKSLPLLAFCFILSALSAQTLVNYTSTRSTGITYNSINTSGTPITFWKNTTVNQNDDNMSSAVPIGFDFWYLGQRYTSVSVSSNGYVHFSSTIYDGNDSPAYPSGSGFATCGGLISYRENAGSMGTFGCTAVAPNFYNGTYLALAPLYTDLWVGNNGSNFMANSVKYELTGTAPNRVFTIEYVAMDDWASALSSNYNFQVKLYETSGIIDFVYGSMISPTNAVTAYGCGLSGIIPNTGITAANLKMQQTANTNTFSQTVKANLTTVPTSNSLVKFLPPCTASPTGTITATGITNSAITINWTNWATNELGYVIYSSTDNINFNFASQTNSNATNYTFTGLAGGTTYYFKVAAITEGCISNFVTGSATTLASGGKISNQTGSWNTASIWTPAGVPTSADNVIIANGHVVTININAVCNSLQVGQGGAATTLQFSGNIARSLTVGSQLNINATGRLVVNTTSNIMHILNIKDNIIVNGIVDLNNATTSGCNTFISNNSGNLLISGTGATVDFANLNVNLKNNPDELKITTSNFSAITNFLTLTRGSLNFSTVNTVNITPFNLSTIIPFESSLTLNSANLRVNTEYLNVAGKLTVTNGTLNVGTVADRDLQLSGGTLLLQNGAINIAGKLQSTGINDIALITINGGTITVPTIGSTNTTVAPVSITGVASKFDMTNGLIIIPKMGGTATQQLGYNISGFTTGSVTGGTLQIGGPLTNVTQTMSIKTTLPIGNLHISSANATARLTNALTVLKTVTFTAGALNTNSLNITVGGDWRNNTGNFIPTNASVNFNSALPQSIYKIGGETFNNITFTGAGVKTFSSAITTNSNITINSGVTVDVGLGNNSLTVKKNFMNSGIFVAQKGEVLLNGTTAQDIGGTTVTDFYNLTLNNTAGAKIISDENLVYTLQLTNGTFNTNGKVFTMLSSANNTARIAPIAVSANIIGNITIQRFAPGGYTGWALLGAPISSPLTLADWDDDIYIACASCPDGIVAGFSSIYTYNEAAVGSYSNPAAYVPLSDINDPILQNKGYWVYLGDGYTNTNPIILDVTGTVRKFNNTIPLSITNTGSIVDDGWNLIQNPYPSPIRWSALRAVATSTAIDNAFYVYNTDLNGGTGATAAYVNGISSPAINAGGISDTIPMCQAFQVHSRGATGFNAVETIKTGGNPTFLKTNQTNTVASSPMPLIRLNLNGLSFNDETVVYVQQGATDNFDSEYDAIRMAGQDPYAPVIRLIDNSNNELQVNGIDLLGNFSMPLHTSTGYNGTYTISLTDYSNFPNGACINLYDTYLNTTTNLKTNGYSFTLLDTTTVARFLLNITLNPLNIISNITQPSCELPNGGVLIAKGLSSGPWNYYWKDESGAIIKSALNVNSADTVKQLVGGNYSVEVNTVGQCDNNTTQFSVNLFNIPVAQFSCADTSYLVNNGLVVFTNNSSNADNNTWNFGDLLGTSTNDNPSYNYLSAGNYTVSLITESATGCLDTTYKKVVIVDNTSVTGINDLQNTYGLSLQTKPDNEFILTGNFTDSENAHIMLIDNQGRIISNMPNVKSENLSLTFSLTNHAKGLYYLEVTGTNTKVVFKLMVQ